MRAIVLLLACAFVFTLSAAGADLAGTYKGTWSGNTGGGEFTLILNSSSGAEPNGQVSFTLDGQPVKCKVTSLKIDGLKIEITYTFEFDESELQSAMTGSIDGGKLEGNYKTKQLSDGSPVDEGTCKASKEVVRL
jgi:hypothetical protein